MYDNFNNSNEMSAEEKIQAVNNLKKSLEDNFVTLGQLLSEIKRTKLFKFKGFKTFKEFVEKEFNLSSTFAARLIGTYELFIEELDIDEASVKDIGLDKLNMIKPMLKDSSYEETEEWIKKAEELPTTELREEIKEIRDRNKEKDKNLKDVFIDQYLERMVTFFNCSRKELNFKLALYFQDADMDEVRNEIRTRQRKFEETGDV
ncbi:MAG: hypothetical protein DRI23_07500 [Candidatus Cloacimonadota bacterium]|nr:MAG: hypothetical protein DRI23_07500 [Candidatus Cloacimonadota bacterium]RLC53328.1 MAG: hypothetical protein DRH79_03790 [Candidatus Cloacimonadota bacterium]